MATLRNILVSLLVLAATCSAQISGPSFAPVCSGKFIRLSFDVPQDARTRVVITPEVDHEFVDGGVIIASPNEPMTIVVLLVEVTPADIILHDHIISVGQVPGVTERITARMASGSWLVEGRDVTARVLNMLSEGVRDGRFGPVSALKDLPTIKIEGWKNDLHAIRSIITTELSTDEQVDAESVADALKAVSEFLGK